MSDNLRNRGLDDRAPIELIVLWLGVLDMPEPENEARFDYPSFMAHALASGLRAKGESDFFA